MNHYASRDFWVCYGKLPATVQELADKAFALLKGDPRHPSLHLKRVDRFWSVRVGLHHRALGVDVTDGVVWFWIGGHAEYDRVVGQQRRGPHGGKKRGGG